MYSSTGTDLGQLDRRPRLGVAVDPDRRPRLRRRGQPGRSSSTPPAIQVGSPIGSADSSRTRSASRPTRGNACVSNHDHSNVAHLRARGLPSDPSTDNPLVIDSVSAAGTRNTADFQVTPSGDDAVFTSTLPLTGYDNAAHREVFRYDAPRDSSTAPPATRPASRRPARRRLAPNGLSLTDDGRVFFNSTEGLVDRDLNEKKDAYEWEPQGPKWSAPATKRAAASS